MTSDSPPARQTRRKVLRTIGGSAFVLGAFSASGSAAPEGHRPILRVNRASYHWITLEYIAPGDGPIVTFTIEGPRGYYRQGEWEPNYTTGAWYELDYEGTYRITADPAGVAVEPDIVEKS